MSTARSLHPFSPVPRDIAPFTSGQSATRFTEAIRSALVNIQAIAGVVIKELYRRKDFYVLFILTALEVGLYEFTYGEHSGPMGAQIQPFFVPVLLLLSAAKFALVAMFYMHLKQDSKLFSGVFVFPLIIAAFIIIALLVLHLYTFAFARSG